MALCDRLEVARGTREAVRDRLAAASLARLNTPDPDTFHDDARFALDALVALTTRPDQIKALRQTVRATRGALRPSGDDFAMLRLVLLALLPQIGGILLMVSRSEIGRRRVIDGGSQRRGRSAQAAAAVGGRFGLTA